MTIKSLPCSIDNVTIFKQPRSVQVYINFLLTAMVDRPANHQCRWCGRTYGSLRNLQRHGRNSHGELPCAYCGEQFATQADLDSHICAGDRRQRRVLMRHPEFDDPTNNPPDTQPADLDDVIKDNWSSIKGSMYQRRYQDILNCRLLRVDGDDDPEGPETSFMRLWGLHDCTFKVNISFGLILRHTISNRLRYYHASSNNATVFPLAVRVSSRGDVDELLRQYGDVDHAALGLTNRENSSWVLYRVTNVTFYVYKLDGVNRIGAAAELPKHIRDCRSILSMNKNRQRGTL